MARAVHDGVFVADSDGLIVECNAAAERLFGSAAAEAIGQPLDRFLIATVQNESGLQGVTAAGVPFPIKAAFDSFVEAEGATLTTIAVRDLSARLSMDARLREHSALLDMVPAAALILDLHGRVRFWNAGAERLFGWSKSEANGATLQAIGLNAGADEARLDCAEHGSRRGELRLTSKSGADLVVESRWTLLRDEQGRPRAHLIVNTEVSQRNRLEAIARRALRLETLDRLANGFAHDFNNRLCEIVSGCEILLAHASAQTETACTVLSRMRTAAEQASSLMYEMMAIRNRPTPNPGVMDLNAALADFEALARRILGKGIALEFDLSAGPLPVRSDPGRLTQIMLSLLAHARESMTLGGGLTFHARTVSDSAEPLVELAMIMCRKDDATGTPSSPSAADVVSGLVDLRADLESNGSRLEVDPGDDSGVTTLRVLLPRIDADGNADRDPPKGRMEVPRGRGVVLLVESETAARKLARLALQSFGYTVIEAADGAQALDLSQGRDGTLDLLVTDLVMPGINGRQLAERLLAARPALRILYTTAYLDDTLARQVDLIPFGPVLSKPFTPTTLARVIHAMLN